MRLLARKVEIDGEGVAGAYLDVRAGHRGVERSAEYVGMASSRVLDHCTSMRHCIADV